MLPLLPQLACTLAETLVTRLIAMDPDALGQLKRIQARQLAFRLKEWPHSIVLTASHDRIAFNQHEEAVDCRITTDLASIKLLRDPSQLTRLIRSDALQIDGDIQVAQQYSHFFQALNPDWQQNLSGYVGDAMAHKLALSLQQLRQYINQKAEVLSQDVTELAQDELRISPCSAELSAFSDEVSRLAARADKLQQQLDKFQEL